jgi:YVTN family beta-propeller protein
VATADVASATITWTTPASDGGSDITGYTVTATDTTISANGEETCTSSSTTCTVTGLTNGDSYTFTVVATNAIGNSTSSAASTSVSPNAVATVPDAPTIVDVIAGNSQAEVEWAAPASDGGSDITGYTVTATDTNDSSNGGETCTTVGPTNCIVIALTNGDSYTFTVTATNAVGTSVASSPSSSVTPANVPEDPSDVTATAGGGSASVSWDAPSDDGGSAIVGYTVTATDLTTSANGDETCTTTGALTCTVTGLTNGDSYIFAVQATNVTGTSTPSLPSSAVTPASAPTVPTEVSAAPDNASANVTWTPSSSDGGFSITGYTVTATDTTTPANGGETCTTTGAITCTVTGLTNGDSYTFAVTATNDIGTSAHSSPSNAVTPVSAPDAPTDVVATPENASATVTWSPPNDGGSPITGYTVIANDVTTPVDGGQSCSTTSATTCTVTGLVNGDSFTFTVRATNAVDPSPFSTASNAVTPATVPVAPTDVTASPEGNAAVVTWTASASDGGSAITSYLVTATDTTNSANGGETCTTAGATTCTVSGLNAGDTYTFSVQAINGVGDSADSSPTGGEVVPEENSVVDSISVIPEVENVWTNPAGTYGYVTGVTGNTIDVVNLATDTVTGTMTVGSASPGQGPDDMVFNSAGTYAYVASEAGVVAVVNLTTNTVVDSIDIANQPNSISIIPGGQYAWVFGQGSGVVSIVDLATNTVTGTFTAVEGLSDPVFNEAGTYGYLADFNTGQVYVVNVATDAVTTLTVGSDPEITANPAGTLAYVENYGSDTISVINLSTNTVTATITVGTSPSSVTFNSAGTYAYVTNSGSNTVSVIDVATATVVATINVGTQPEDFDFNNAGTYAYVIDSGSNTVSVIDLATETVTGTVNIGSDSNGIWMSSDGEWGYVTNMGSNTVTAINLTTNTPTTITVGTEPANYAVNGSGTYLYVANMGSGTISVIAIG